MVKDWRSLGICDVLVLVQGVLIYKVTYLRYLP